MRSVDAGINLSQDTANVRIEDNSVLNTYYALCARLCTATGAENQARFRS